MGDFDKDELAAFIDADTLRDTQRAITAWLTEALRIKGATFPNRSIDSLLEFRTMLEENIDRWLQRRHDAGEALGALKTTRAHLSKLITIKFGPREGRDAELEARPIETLELALERILLVDSEDALWT